MNLTSLAEQTDFRSKSEIQSALSLIETAPGILLDWDGCVAIADRPSTWAAQFIRERLDRTAIVSNNSTHLPEDFAGILAKAEIEIDPTRIVLAGVEALNRAAEWKPRGVLVLGDSRMKAYARNRGLPLVQDKADLVVLLRDTRFSFPRLERAANALRNGARLIVANPDMTHPGRRGAIIPETGALHAALLACLNGSEVETEVIGKPGPRLFERACRALGVSPQSALIIGDNPATDIAGADALGMASILVGARSGIGFQDLLLDGAGDPARAARRRKSGNGST